jgi:hypothetical protein
MRGAGWLVRPCRETFSCFVTGGAGGQWGEFGTVPWPALENKMYLCHKIVHVVHTVDGNIPAALASGRP